jgi:hypothetical protein
LLQIRKESTMITGNEADRVRQAYDDTAPVKWLQWGPYLSERQWATVREDYSPYGTAWDYFPHDAARSRAYRWGEDGMAGLCDDQQQLCFALAMWNGKDPILKERPFGLTNDEGNHGEDVKEYYFYCDNTPSHSYMKWLYKYPQAAYPYVDLIQENQRRRSTNPRAFEYELLDTGVFDQQRYFDVQVEYAKVSPTDILIRISATNHGPATAALQLLPTLWYRNTWSWDTNTPHPSIVGKKAAVSTIQATPPAGVRELTPMMLYCENAGDLFFCDNETNSHRLFQSNSSPQFPKDGINDHVVGGKATINPALTGTKASASYALNVAAGQTTTIRLRLTANLAMAAPFGPDFDTTFTTRIAEADEFYKNVGPATLTADQQAIQRQAYAGMLWSKQFYHYVVSDWLDGDPATPTPPASRNQGRNSDWRQFFANDILAMPDTWEYPWFASWDLCFHATVYARIDVKFAKQQLLTIAGAWYMSPDGAVPAYEWSFSDVNPPLHAWAALRIAEIEGEVNDGAVDLDFLTTIFSMCLNYFTWWSNRKNSDQMNLFEGGFLGLDNISILQRSNPPPGEELYQSDGTSWMAMFCLNMMNLSLLLSRKGRNEYDDFAEKFFQHFVIITDALNHKMQSAYNGPSLWDDNDHFYYDVLKPSGSSQYQPIRLRSLVGLIPLFSVAMLDLTALEADTAADIEERIAWFKKRHPELLNEVVMAVGNDAKSPLLTLVDTTRLKQILIRALDQNEFLSPHGIRGISRVYAGNPFTLPGQDGSVPYEPAEASQGGTNSNWRGPVWFPINFLLIDALRRLHYLLSPTITVEYPTGSGVQHTLLEIGADLAKRMVSIFERDAAGNRPVYGGTAMFQKDPHWKDLILFFEYFHGDNGAGLGASHQTGWTGLVTELLRLV